MSQESPDVDPNRNCTVEMYAAAKQLPVSLLLSLGLETVPNPHDAKRLAMRIPYLAVDGAHYRDRLRVSLSTAPDAKADRFLWDQRLPGTGQIAYGLHRLESDLADAPKEFLLLEGESDTQTAWHHGYRALGLPGAASFRSERDDPHLDCEEVIYAVIEPDAGGASFIRALSKSRNRARIKLLRLTPFKDLSDLHVAGEDHFRARLTAAVEAAAAIDEHLEQHPELDELLDTHDPEPPRASGGANSGISSVVVELETRPKKIARPGPGSARQSNAWAWPRQRRAQLEPGVRLEGQRRQMARNRRKDGAPRGERGRTTTASARPRRVTTSCT